ncbi:helix-turn-helix transcriptional regulator [Caminibacter pacificus]|uniref:DNA-binding transcriptional regulator YafY n=1 Tax=Caminibacter pacificus TaxID=1424653 RepID=A0AAJ4UX46_9BACT|nr:WYL domain-containing protein [Caminibacter pacificus]QCI27477.1 WYL domain-containing protein [Caminibacter pacificus]ROR38916.1 putative DNA-binding transcriptional regulator YafY [Caminibacter pacificus]
MKAKEYTKTLSILLQLINKFYQGENLSTSDIEKIYGVSKRTAQRYINYLREAGFNIQKKGKKYYLDTIIDNEKETIFEAILSIAKNADIEEKISPLLTKLKLISKENVFYSKFDIEKIDPQILKKIETAIKQKKIIKMKYKMNKRLINMEIKPIKISNFDGYWYVNALNHKNEYRTYHIKSIHELQVTNHTFDIKENILKDVDKAVNIWFKPKGTPFLVELIADEFATKYLQRIPISKTQKIIKNSDETSTIYLEITDKNEIIHKLLMWIPHLAVVSPKWLKKEVDNYIIQYIEKFMKL